MTGAGRTEQPGKGRSPGRRFRILYVDNEVVWRGGQEQLFGLMCGMARRGHSVNLAAPADSPLAERAKSAGIEVLPFRQRSELSLTAIVKFFQLVRECRCDIVHFNTPTSVVAGSLAARLSSVPVIVCSRRVNFPLRSGLSVIKYNRLIDRMLTVSNSIRETLLQAGVKEQLVQVVYEGVDLKWIDSLPLPESESWGPGPVIGTVAHLSHEKGHDTLLEALAILKKRIGPLAAFQAVIVGEGERRGFLERLVRKLDLEDLVHFTGFRTNAEALMKGFDVFCLPSLSEGLSSAILAAMACRLPVVSTRVGGIPELVIDGETGFLVPPSDHVALAEALARLIADPALRLACGTAGRKRIESLFTVEKKLGATEWAYSKLLEEKGLR